MIVRKVGGVIRWRRVKYVLDVLEYILAEVEDKLRQFRLVCLVTNSVFGL